jgi:hypothetical protein
MFLNKEMKQHALEPSYKTKTIKVRKTLAFKKLQEINLTRIKY